MSGYVSYPSAVEPPREQPLYGATMLQAVKRFFTKYAVFTGRASRSEFWWVYLAMTIVSTAVAVLMFIAIGAVAASTDFGALDDPAVMETAGMGLFGIAAVFYAILAAFGLAILVPNIAVTVRRLHDAGFSGWWYLINFVPGGSIVVLVFTILPSVAEGARFDDPPYGYPPAPNSPFLVPAYPAAAGYQGGYAGGWTAPPSTPPAGPTQSPPRER
ncbi:DUF805 domain-containing protein [Zhihengliuella halotolerans]|uniref:Uncharacterized membrane protein YhaH (DUF805 family) n=1 Tax=Zhihengliuella halotolerans TaxID=370736 RepID=A0A4Q8AGT9_9MICC|nr:DUF805 domain-containing protein [Zhihengliuella halotolerans]RZU62879.1 uncharacterized membrane protein YhaH (DUF805 family) [Zhihengliuella halotolerans]